MSDGHDEDITIIERLPYPTFDSIKVDQIRVYGSIPKIYVVGS
jgi:hypothetical protein